MYQEETQGILVMENLLTFSNIVYSAKKDKYKPKATAREKTDSCVEFRADEKVKKIAMLHIKLCNGISQRSLRLVCKSQVSWLLLQNVFACFVKVQQNSC